ncbi:MAG TPA: galactose ABC transporter substrate-binding protein, partial [Clostridium sp.]
MKRLRKILTIIIVIFMIIVTLTDCSKKAVSTIATPEKPVKVAVFLLDFTDDLISLIRQNLEDIQKENQGKVEYTFYDGKSDQAIQTESIDKVLKEGIDLILLNIVNRGDAQTVINKIKQTNTPVILFNREPVTPVPIQSYNKAIYIGTDAKQAGILQGKMLVDAWNTSREYIDQNKDKTMQYVMLEGESDNTEAIERTKYSVSTIEDAGIKTQQISLKVCDWLEDCAYNATKSLFLKYGNQIEVIIANDDTMAIGAIKALQEYG